MQKFDNYCSSHSILASFLELLRNRPSFQACSKIKGILDLYMPNSPLNARTRGASRQTNRLSLHKTPMIMMGLPAIHFHSFSCHSKRANQPTSGEPQLQVIIHGSWALLRLFDQTHCEEEDLFDDCVLQDAQPGKRAVCDQQKVGK